MNITARLDPNNSRTIILNNENFNIEMGFSLNIAEKNNEGKQFYIVDSCRETTTRDRYVRHHDSSYYIIPSFYILRTKGIEKIGIANAICSDFLYKINYQFFHEDMLNYLYTQDKDILHNLYVGKIKKTHSKYSTACTRNKKTGMKLYELERINQVIDSWNLLCLRSFIYAGVSCQLDDSHYNVYQKNKNLYMDVHFKYFKPSLKAIQYYDVKIKGEETHYRNLNNNFGILDFFNSIGKVF